MTGVVHKSFTLGAASLGNLYRPMSDEAANELLEAAWGAGVRSFDTAPHYGLGLSERRLGEFLRMKPRDEYQVSTKVGRLLVPTPESAHLKDDQQFDVSMTHKRVWDASADGIQQSLEDSLSRLGLDRIDTIYLHDPEEYGLEQSLASALPAMRALREAGVVRAVGVGARTIPGLLAAVEYGGLTTIMTGGRYTLLERGAEEKLLPACIARGITVAAAAVFNSGLLASSELGSASRYEYGPVPAGVLADARRLDERCRRAGVKLSTAAVQFPLRHEAVSAVVSGADRAEQVVENVRRFQEQIPNHAWAQILEKDDDEDC